MHFYYVTLASKFNIFNLHKVRLCLLATAQRKKTINMQVI